MDIDEEESIMDKFLEGCQEQVFINNEKYDDKTKELLNTRIAPINIREQIDNIILNIYALGKLSTEQIANLHVRKKVAELYCSLP